MHIWIKTYRRRDGEIMIYLNNDRGVSLGISHDQGYQSSKASQGQKNLWTAFFEAMAAATPIAEAIDVAEHNEWKLSIDWADVHFVITDIATVGGQSVSSDGLYVVHKGRLLPDRFKVDS